MSVNRRIWYQNASILFFPSVYSISLVCAFGFSFSLPHILFGLNTQLSSLSPGTLDHFFFSCRLCCLIPRSRIPSMKHWVPFFVSFLSLSPQLLNGFKRKRNWPFMILSIMHSLFPLSMSLSPARLGHVDFPNSLSWFFQL